jgi:hypothetical protein
MKLMVLSLSAINENQYHPISLTHAGTVTFKERIVVNLELNIFWFYGKEHMKTCIATPLRKFKKSAQTK